MYQRYYDITGLSLLELMLALSLTTVVFSCVLSILPGLKNSWRTIMALQTQLSHGRQAESILRHDIRVAGFLGCAVYDEAKFGAALSGDDQVITTRHAYARTANVMRPMSDVMNVIVENRPEFKADDRLVITDCEHAEIFTARSAELVGNHLQRIVSKEALQYRYPLNAELSLYRNNTYMIESTGREFATGKPVLALYRHDASGRRTEMVEGIDAMQIKYDVVVNHYLQMLVASAVPDWSAVTGVEVELIVNGGEVAITPLSYVFHIALQA